MKKPTRHKITKSASFVLTYSRNDPACVPNQSVGLNHSNVNFNLIRNVSICSLHLKPSWSLNFMGSSSFLRSNNSIQFHTKTAESQNQLKIHTLRRQESAGADFECRRRRKTWKRAIFPMIRHSPPVAPSSTPSCSFSH